ncbi:MAG: hypothetical protein IJ122_05985 [Methanobrevibacter sp.]|nr:hypothetical protein [Methanobrevibacter sp.]
MSGMVFTVWTLRVSDGAEIDKQFVNLIEDSLSSTRADASLSAKQGKVLNDKIGGDLSNLTTTDKTSLIAAINELNTNLGTVNTALQTLLNGTGA